MNLLRTSTGGSNFDYCGSNVLDLSHTRGTVIFIDTHMQHFLSSFYHNSIFKKINHLQSYIDFKIPSVRPVAELVNSHD
jgi:hypothetical protein